MSGSPLISPPGTGLNGLLSALSAPDAAVSGPGGALFSSILNQQSQSLATGAAQGLPHGGQALPHSLALPALAQGAAVEQLQQSMSQLLDQEGALDSLELPDSLRQQLQSWLSEFSGLQEEALSEGSDADLLTEFSRAVADELKSWSEQVRSQNASGVDPESLAGQGMPESLARLFEPQVQSQPVPRLTSDSDPDEVPLPPLLAGLRKLVNQAEVGTPAEEAKVSGQAEFADIEMASESSEGEPAVLMPTQSVQEEVTSDDAQNMPDTVSQQPAVDAALTSEAMVAQQAVAGDGDAAARPERDGSESAEVNPDVPQLSAAEPDETEAEAGTLWAAQSSQAGADAARNTSAPVQSQVTPSGSQSDGRSAHAAMTAAAQALGNQADAADTGDAESAAGGRTNETSSGLFQSQLNAQQQQRAVTDQQQVQQAIQQGPRLASPAWQQNVGERLVMMVGQGKQTAQINLDPPELGALQIRIQVDNGQVSVSFSSPHPVVREAVEGSMVRLREMFEEQGLQLGDASVGDQTQQDPRHQSQGGGAEYPYASAHAGGVDQPMPEQVRGLSLVDFYA